MRLVNMVKFPRAGERRFRLYASKEDGKVITIDNTAIEMAFPMSSYKLILSKAEVESIYLATYGSDQSGWTPPADDIV